MSPNEPQNNMTVRINTEYTDKMRNKIQDSHICADDFKNSPTVCNMEEFFNFQGLHNQQQNVYSS